MVGLLFMYFIFVIAAITFLLLLFKFLDKGMQFIGELIENLTR